MNAREPSQDEQRVLALAGVCQCALLAQEFARRGHAQPEPLRCALESILVLNQNDTEGALGGVQGVYAGLPDIARKSPDPSAVERLRYAIAMIDIQKRLRRDSAVASRLRSQLEEIRDGKTIQDPVSPEGITVFADIYSATVSLLTPKIIIRGSEQHLKDETIVLKVLAVLLAGVRAAYLFHELGGRKWQILVGRKKLADSARRLLDAYSMGRY